jgi:competence protein ComEC
MRKRSYIPMILIALLVAGLSGIYFFLDSGIVGIEKTSEVERIENTPLPVKVHFIDIGQGDATFIEILGQTMLIDAGEKEHAEKIIEYLKSYDVEKLDYVIATHPHEDHIGGMGEVLSAFDVASFYMPDKHLVTKSFQHMMSEVKNHGLDPLYIKGGMVLNFSEDIRLEFLSPNRDSYLNPNNYSPIMRLVVGNNAFLFTADAEELIEQEVLRLGVPLEAEVMKVPHHGSKTSSSEAFLEKVTPRYGVVTSGLGNDHNLPSPEILERYDTLGIQILLTEELGTIVFGSKGNEVIPLRN